ncbi:hypothetical protein [Bernardetia sp.]|uniref:hypothetical protein n=1 Tax=Bernardetia sp. TaxID=1937974 RepID=UPI0025B9F235|nr:hypothetical protein [Bernardetia sp.]
MVHTEYKNIIKEFVKSFNQMCNKTGHNLLIRKHTYHYETGSETVDKEYRVKFKQKRNDNTWEIYATPTSWFSSKKFPLIKLEFSDKIILTGIGISTGFAAISTKESGNNIVENNSENLKKLLEDYKEKIRKMSPATFSRL